MAAKVNDTAASSSAPATSAGAKPKPGPKAASAKDTRPGKGKTKGGKGSRSRSQSANSSAGRKKGNDKTGDPDKACYYHNQKMGSCLYGKKCKFIHKLVSAENKSKIRRPNSVGGSSSSRPSTPTKGKSKLSSRESSTETTQSPRSGSGVPKGKGKAGKIAGIVCREFTKGSCNYGDGCRFMHIKGTTAQDVTRELERIRNQMKGSAATASLESSDPEQPEPDASPFRSPGGWMGDRTDGDYYAL